MSVIPEKYADILQAVSYAHIATIGPKGEPQTTPVWFAWDGTHIRFSLTKGRQKYRNLSRNPSIALSVLDPASPYRYIEVRGSVAAIEDDKENAFINSMAKKYMGQDVYPFNQPGDERVVVVVQPEHTTQMG